MKKLILFILSLFLIYMPFCGMAKALDSPPGLSNTIIDKIWGVVRANPVSPLPRNHNRYLQYGLVLCSEAERIFKDCDVNYMVLVCAFKDGNMRSVIFLLQNNDCKEKIYVCDAYKSFFCWVNTHDELLAKKYLFRCVKNCDIFSVFPNAVGRIKAGVYFNKNGKEICRKVLG